MLGICWIIGISIAMVMDDSAMQLDFNSVAYGKAGTPIEASLCEAEATMQFFSSAAADLKTSVAAAAEKDAALNNQLAALAKKTASNKNLSIETYENIIVSRLGNAIYNYKGTNSNIMIFKLNKEGFRGYMAKIKLKNSTALRVTLAPEDKVNGETTSQAAKRYGAIFAVNGGGFAYLTTDGVKRLVPLGTTMVKGSLVGDFQASYNNLSFAGFSKTNKLVGGQYQTEEDLLASGAWQGISFVPALVRDWDPLTIPSKWASAREPRTVLGQYPNGDIFFIVVDGRESNNSTGITLEEMQVLLLHLGIMEAFNLDGGGSSAMYYNGKILNSPSDGSQRKLATNIVVMP